MHCCLVRVYENVNKREASGEVDKVLIFQSILANYKLLIWRLKAPILAYFLSTTFYDLKVTFRYIGESPENTQEV